MNEVVRVQAAHKNVFVALAAAQSEMGPLIKGSTNPAFKSKYADLADLTAAVREPLTRNGLTYFHQMICGDRDLMRTALVHGESETRIECDVPLIVAKNDMQGMKSATTYAKRIGLESVTGVAPEDDDGNAAAKAAPMIEQRGPSKAVTEAVAYLAGAKTLPDLQQHWANLPTAIKAERAVIEAKDTTKAKLQSAPADMAGDEIPY